MSEEHQVIAPLDAEALQAGGFLHPSSSPGSRRLHKRRLNRSSEEEYQDVPVYPIPPASNSPESEEAYVVIPEVIFSRDTLIYVGLSAQKADEIWQKWDNWTGFEDGVVRETDPDDNYCIVMEFIEFITGQTTSGIPDTASDDDTEWKACMDMCGLVEETQQAIMHPAFAELRQSDSCLYWVEDTIRLRYATLKEIQRTSREREMAIRRERSRLGGHQGGGGARQHRYYSDETSSPIQNILQ